MKLATRPIGTPDGELLVVSSDGHRCLAATGVAGTLQEALENWQQVEPALREIAHRLESGSGEPLDARSLLAPLPRAWQWLDGSAFDAHGRLMTKLFGIDAKQSEAPLMYQGMSHQFLAPNQDVPFRNESDGIDFEGEFAIVTDSVPMGVGEQDAVKHIKLVMMVNDWSLRALAREEMKTGFGWIHAKPACSAAPFAVTPDELGEEWAHGRVQVKLRVEINGVWFGEPSGGEMGVSFGGLVAHAAATRSLCAGTIIGSGTVSNDDYRTTGSTCIAERRAIETLEQSSRLTEFLRFGDRIHMMAVDRSGRSPFGEIHQKVVKCSVGKF